MKKTIIILAIACFALPQLAFAGAWTVPKNSFWGQYLIKSKWAGDDFGNDDKQTRRRKNNEARSWGWSMIPELHYGVTDWFEAFSLLEYKEDKYNEIVRPANWGEYRRKSSGLTNVDFGGKLRLFENPLVVATQLRASIYTGNGQDYEPQLHDGHDSLELKALVSKKFETKWPFYFGLESGYRFKNRRVTNDIPIFGEVGVWPIKWLLVKTEIDGYWAHDGSGKKAEKSYAIWRIGPVLELFTLWNTLRGTPTTTLGDTVTRKGKSLNLETQYGMTFWGRNTSADQELVFKISAQY